MFYPLLKSVSRSFYLSIRFLPQVMREPVGIAYLLARATDTIADSAQYELPRRLDHLDQMRQMICEGSTREHQEEFFKELGQIAELQTHEGEKNLLLSLNVCLELLGRCSAEEQALIREVLHTIIEGQIWDLEYFQHRTQVESDEELLIYTYRVAGCVGEFWTKLGLLSLGDRFSIQDENFLLLWGKHYGMALQLVNILRDREEDLQKGRIYVPAGSTDWFSLASSWFEEAYQYTYSLVDRRLRFATVLPAYLGEETLQAILKNPSASKVKIRRKDVYRNMCKAIGLAFTPPA